MSRALEGRTPIPITLLPNPDPDKVRRKIARATLRMPEAMRGVMGQSAAEAREVLKRGKKVHAASTLAAKIRRKVSPQALRTSGKMTAMLAFLLDAADWTSPEIIELNATSDGYLLATTSNGAMGQFFGTVDDALGNLRGLVHQSILTQAEGRYLLGRFETLTGASGRL